jgi:hypothetical protein
MFGLIFSCHLHLKKFLVCFKNKFVLHFSSFVLLVLFSFTCSKSRAFLCLFMSFFNRSKVHFRLVHYVHTKQLMEIIS